VLCFLAAAGGVVVVGVVCMYGVVVRLSLLHGRRGSAGQKVAAVMEK